MATDTKAEIQAYIRELQARAAKSQEEAERELNPLFKRKEGRPPRDFVDSSFLYIRSCDADVGSRPVPCPAFWLSPDVRVAPLSNLGAPTRQLEAGATYRFSAVVRNRLRRQLRAAALEVHHEGVLAPRAHLVVVRPDAAGASYTTLRRALAEALRRLGPPRALVSGGDTDLGDPHSGDRPR